MFESSSSAAAAAAAAAGKKKTRSDSPPFGGSSVTTLKMTRTIRSTAASLCAGTALRARAAASDKVYAFSSPSSFLSDRRGSRESASEGFSFSPARGSTGQAESKSKRRREEADGGGGLLSSAAGVAASSLFFFSFFFVAFSFPRSGGGKQGAPVELSSRAPSDGRAPGGAPAAAAIEEDAPFSAVAFFCFSSPRLRRNSTAAAGKRASASDLASASSSGAIEESITEASPLESLFIWSAALGSCEGGGGKRKGRGGDGAAAADKEDDAAALRASENCGFALFHFMCRIFA